MAGLNWPSGRLSQLLPPAETSRPAFLATVPEDAPLDMPVQSLKAPAAPTPRAGIEMAMRRLVLFGGVALATAAAAAVMAELLAAGGFGVLDTVTLILFSVLFAWTLFGFGSAVAGFALRWAAPVQRREGPQPIVLARTAILMPIYNEDPGRVLTAARATWEALDALGVAALYDLYLLSDTRDERIAADEAAGVMRLRVTVPEARVFYRRRPVNRDRKAGNVADWVRRHGGDYDFMLVLDADSLMTGETIVRLTAAMQDDPAMGLLQTSPTIVNARTLFARLQQFANRAYGGMLAAGQDWWSGGEGNFWGHNAIIRVEAFAHCCGLPHLPGRKPFGGHIMSHDFVEAALLRRGGWTVRMAADLGGSFEEAPPTVLDMAVRDRRWCQGNLQHAGVLTARGLHWISRVHLARGMLAYLTSPLWLFLLCGGAGVWVAAGAPNVADARSAAWLFGVTMALLLAPKLMAAALVARDRRGREGFGGRTRFAVGVLVETAIAALVAPVMMLMQSAAVLEVLMGRDSGWGAQQRDPGRLTRREAWRTHRGHVAIGLASAGLALALDPAIFWWTSPVHLGLVLSAPLSALLARIELGDAARALGLFVIPEEREVPTVVARAAELRDAYDAEARMRREIERLMREPVPVHEIESAGWTVAGRVTPLPEAA